MRILTYVLRKKLWDGAWHFLPLLPPRALFGHRNFEDINSLETLTHKASEVAAEWVQWNSLAFTAEYDAIGLKNLMNSMQIISS